MRRQQHKQQGSMLLELMVVVLILTLLAGGSVALWQKRAEKLQVEELATWMTGVHKGVQHYLESVKDNYPQNLTVSQLKADGFLPNSYPDNSQVAIRLVQEGEDCTEQICHRHGVIYSQRPLVTKSGQVDHEKLMHWRLKTKGEGAVVSESQPEWLGGESVRVENTASNFGLVLPAGTVAVVASFSPAQDILAGRYLLFSHTEELGESCTVNGALARANDQQGLVICEDGKWIQASADNQTSEPTQTAQDPATLQEIFRRAWGAKAVSDPIAEGGYIIMIEGHNQGKNCVLRSSVSGSCSCLKGHSRRLADIRSVNVRYSSTTSRSRSLYLYKCV